MTALAIILVITTFILVGLNALNLQQRMSLTSSLSPSGSANQGYIDGYKAARAKYAALCALPIENVMNFSATVKAVNANGLTVTALTLDTDPKVDGISNDREITVTAETKIQKLTDKTPEEMSAEANATTTPPSPFKITQLQLKDLTVGETITISSATDVRLAPVITAQAITIR